MNVEYWKIGSKTPTPLPLTSAEISAHLIADWVPSLPTTVGAAFMGWPLFLIEPVEVQATSFQSLREETGRTERQWKSVVSWMLGVAGTRHVLAQEGYRWIAPTSAFYPNAAQIVDLSAWHPNFPRSSVAADLPAGTRYRLRPDYIAIRQATARVPVDWAVAESKGTASCLTNMTSCPRDWYNQAHNIEISVNGSAIRVPRHIVVATRVNPNAAYSRTRRLQVRAWNSREMPHAPLMPLDAVADIAAAHLFGLFRNLRLRENAKALAASVQARAAFSGRGGRSISRTDLTQLRAAADAELERKADFDRMSGNVRSSAHMRIDTDAGETMVEIDSATTSLAAALSVAEDPTMAREAMVEANERLEEWDRSIVQRRGRRIALPSGVAIEFPDEYYEEDRLTSR